MLIAYRIHLDENDAIRDHDSSHSIRVVILSTLGPKALTAFACSINSFFLYFHVVLCLSTTPNYEVYFAYLLKIMFDSELAIKRFKLSTRVRVDLE